MLNIRDNMNNGYRYLREDTYEEERPHPDYEGCTYTVNLEDYVSNMNTVRMNMQHYCCLYAY